MLRAFIYLVAGALLVTWVSPPPGLLRYALIIGLILGAAFVDHWLRGRGRQGRSAATNVVSLLGHRRPRGRAAGGLSPFRERRGLRVVYSSAVQADADELLELLRTEGLRPIMVSQNTTFRQSPPQFEIRLPEHEARKARSLIEMFKLQAHHRPN